MPLVRKFVAVVRLFIRVRGIFELLRCRTTGCRTTEMDPEYKVGATNIFVAKGDKKVEGITNMSKILKTGGI